MKTFLFIGGQYHGQMLPICDESVREAEASVDYKLRATANHRGYQGYRFQRLDLGSGGFRMVAIFNATRQAAPARLVVYIVDAFSTALDNQERARQRTYKEKIKFRRILPLNDTLMV